jgi:lactate permease
MDLAADLPVDWLHWIAAAIPLGVLLVLLIGLRWKAAEAGSVGMFVAAGLALLLFRAPWETVAVAGAKGIWDAIFILYVIWPALILYRVTDRAGGFVALREEIERFSDNELFLVLGFGWIFASFLQGITGFGTPVAVVAPLLVALGVRPVYAVAIPLIGHAWANLFGTLGVAWLATQTVVDLQDPGATALQTAVLLWIPNVMAGIGIAWLFGRMPAVRHGIPLILILSGIHGGLQLVLTLWNPLLATFVASSAALVALYPLSHWKRYSEPARGIESRPAMSEPEEEAEHDRAAWKKEEPEPVMGLGMALLPYGILTVVTVGALTIAPIERALESIEIGLPFPAVGTGYAVESEAEDPYSPFAPLTHPGTFLLIASLAGWAVYRSRGLYRKWQEREKTTPLWAGVAGDAVPASIAIVVFVAMSTIMGHSGQTEVLALGVADVAPPLVFAFSANWIGALGSFMTSSNTTSNILFAPLQQTLAGVEGLSEAGIIAAQHAGGAIGNAVSPANVVLGTGTAGILGREGEVLRKTIPWAAVAALLTGGATLLLL